MVPRAERPNRRSSGVFVACQRRQGCGERVPEEYLTLGAGVACYMSQEGGKWVYECQGTSGSQMGKGSSLCGPDTSGVPGGESPGYTRDIWNVGQGRPLLNQIIPFRTDAAEKTEEAWRSNFLETAGLDSDAQEVRSQKKS